MVVSMWFGDYMFCICSSSAPKMFLKYDRTRKVDNLAYVAWYASLGQLCYVFGILVVCA